jgi:hypothetical protein
VVSVEKTGKNNLQPGQESMGNDPVLSHYFCYEIYDQNRPVFWSIVVNAKQNVDSPVFGAFPSDRIHKATKDVSARLFIHISSSCKLYQQIRGILKPRKPEEKCNFNYSFLCLLVANMKICLRSE